MPAAVFRDGPTGTWKVRPREIGADEKLVFHIEMVDIDKV